MKKYTSIYAEVKDLATKYAFEEEGLRIGDITGTRQETTGTTSFAERVRGLMQKWYGFSAMPLMSCSDLDLAWYHADGTYAVCEAKCWSVNAEYLLSKCCQRIDRTNSVVLPKEQVDIEYNTWASRYERRTGIRPVASSMWILDGEYIGKVSDGEVDGASACVDPVYYVELLCEMVGMDVDPRPETIEARIEFAILNSVYELNDYIHRMSVREGKLGQNFTPAKVALRLCSKAMPWLSELYHAHRYSELSELILKTKIFDPACGDGAILLAAYRMLQVYLNACDTSLVLPKSNFFGIEIEEKFAKKCELTFAELDGLYGDRPNVMVANSLDVDWLEFTGGVENVVLISNFPFESGITLRKSELGTETYKSAKQICGSMALRQTCDTAFFIKAIKSGYTFRAIGCYTSSRFVKGLVGETYEWSAVNGDASIKVCEYTYSDAPTMQVTPSRKPLTNAFCCHSTFPRERKDVIAICYTGVFHGECFTQELPKGELYVMPTIIGNPLVRVPDNVRYCKGGIHYMTDVTEWSREAFISTAFIEWCRMNATAYAPGSSNPQLNISAQCNTFPLFQGDDLSHFDTMSSEDIRKELLARYNALIAKS